MTPANKTVAVVGGTGTLGTLIVDALLARPGTRVRMLVRSESRGKAASQEQRGVEVVEGDIGPDHDDALAKLCDGVVAVVSAAQGGPDVIMDGQQRLLAAARKAGVRRFIPSDFSFDLFRLDEGENINADWRRQFARIAETERGATAVVHILNGCFLDRQVLFGFLGAFDLRAGTAFVWGDGAQPMDFTSMTDTAQYTAEVATDDADVPGVFGVAGDVRTFDELVRAYEQGSGKRLTVERRGSLEDLDNRIAALVKNEPGNMFAYLPLMYYRAMLNGKGKLRTIMNDRYAGVKPVSVQDYVASEGL
jgi:nucleoside-diphosphate-sugar epimerase